MLIRLKALIYGFMRWFRYAKNDCIMIWKTSQQTRKIDRWVRTNIPGGWGLILAVLIGLILFLIVDAIGIMGLLKILLINTIIVACIMALVIFVPQILEECRD